MDKEVDVQLFVTCRMCIEELGQYQILPTVQEQLKYCFEINVDPFDGLPQLLCQKCKDILSNFYNLKKRYCEKQADLINKCKIGTFTKCMPQHDVVSSSQRSEIIESKKVSTTEIKRNKYSSELDDSVAEFTQRKKNKKTIRKPLKWNCTGFKKEFVCTVCESVFSNYDSFMKHQSSHINFLAKYSTIFKKNCSVTLEKIDSKPNITGLSSIVVHSNNRIIENCNSLYYIKYSKERSTSAAKKITSESTDTDEEFIGNPRQSKRLRLLSKSSCDTIVPESNKSISDNEDLYKPRLHSSNVAQHPHVTVSQCINIDDSSDSDAERNQVDSTYKIKQPVEAKLDDHKVIQGIISGCVNAYNRKMDPIEKLDKHNTEYQLNAKVLNIGRKIINKPGFNFAGLLKYMEHKNLNILWVPITANISKDSNYIRIMTKLRGPDTTSEILGWTPIDLPNELEPVPESLDIKQVNLPVADNIQPDSNSAVLLVCNQTDHRSKILNANPVANPKQLPRKITQTNDQKFNISAIETDTPFHNNEDVNLCMPIITSTTSLAVSNVKEQQNGDTAADAVASTKAIAPKMNLIRVKPVSELMSAETLNNLRNESSSTDTPSNLLQNQIDHTSAIKLNPITNNSNTSWSSRSSVSNLYLSNMVPLIPVAPQPLQLVQYSVPQTTQYDPTKTLPSSTTLNTTNTEEYIILDSVDLPNTKTVSPFKYLKSLFLLHDLVLIEHPNLVTRDFICLIKFKVKFQQEPIDEPVVLCLSLFCYLKNFCITVKDRNQVIISINQISPNWQWEIINVFRGNPVEKMLQQNSQKHSKETNDNTNKFLCLLKSVTCKKS